MSIATAITNAQNKVAAAYSKCNEKGATMPATQDLSHLANCINSIQTGSSMNLQTLSVTPSTSSQHIVPSSPVDGYNEVNVSAVDSSIDANIVASNIKDGVSILGVLGTLTGSGISLSGYSKGSVVTYQASSSVDRPTITIPGVLGETPKVIIGVITSGSIAGRTSCIGPFFVVLQSATGQTSSYAAATTALNNGEITPNANNPIVTVNNDYSVTIKFNYGWMTAHYGFSIILLA